MQNLNTVDPKPMATLADYFNEPAIADELYSACEDFEFIDLMRLRIEEVSAAGEWNEQLNDMCYHIRELKSLINEMEALIMKAPNWPVTLSAMKHYTFAIGKANECHNSIMAIAQKSLVKEFPLGVKNSTNVVEAAR